MKKAITLLFIFATACLHSMEKDGEGKNNKRKFCEIGFADKRSNKKLKQIPKEVAAILSENPDALHDAIADDNYELLQKLVDYVDLGAENSWGQTPLYSAVDYENLPALKLLLEKGVEVKEVPYENGVSPLHIAVKNGSLEIVKVLIEHGADINAISEDPEDSGRTPLLLAIGENAEIAQFLIEKGADVHAVDECNISTLHYSDAKSAKMLIEAGVDLEGIEDIYGGTPLFTAVLDCLKKSVRLLIKKEADVYCRLPNGDTLLHVFAKESENGKGQLEDYLTIAKNLIKAGLDVNLKNNNGETPLFSAFRDGCIEKVIFLIRNGADVHEHLPNGDTLLHLMAKFFSRSLDNLVVDNIRFAVLLSSFFNNYWQKNNKGLTAYDIFFKVYEQLLATKAHPYFKIVSEVGGILSGKSPQNNQEYFRVDFLQARLPYLLRENIAVELFSREIGCGRPPKLVSEQCNGKIHNYPKKSIN